MTTLILLCALAQSRVHVIVEPGSCDVLAQRVAMLEGRLAAAGEALRAGPAVYAAPSCYAQPAGAPSAYAVPNGYYAQPGAAPSAYGYAAPPLSYHRPSMELQYERRGIFGRPNLAIAAGRGLFGERIYMATSNRACRNGQCP